MPVWSGGGARVESILPHTVTRVAAGPVAAFTAWNFPVNLPSRKLGSALAAGRSVRQLRLEQDLLNRANELLKKDLGVDLQLLSNREKTLLMDALREHYGLPELLAQSGLARSSYFYHRARAACKPLKFVQPLGASSNQGQFMLSSLRGLMCNLALVTEHRFGLQILFKSDAPPFAPVARPAVAAKRRRMIGACAVEMHHAGAQAPCDALRMG